MPSEFEVLERLNVEIGSLETQGDRDRLATVIAPELAFLRANAERTIDGAKRYLDKVASSDDRDTVVESIDIVGSRAIVKCVVTLKPSNKSYHNLRLFVKLEQQWRLLGWANEPLNGQS